MSILERLRFHRKRLRRQVKAYLRHRYSRYLNDLRYGHLPIVLVTGTVGKTTTSRLITSILRATGKRVGLACTDGIYVDGECMEEGDLAYFTGARTLMRTYKPEAAVLETARGGLRTEGLFMKHRKVGVFTNVGSDHIGVDGIDSLDAMARHKGQVVLGSRYAVLNGDDPRVASYVGQIRLSRTVLFSVSGTAPDIDRVIAGGGTVVRIDEAGRVVALLRDRPAEIVVAVADVPITLGGKARNYSANVLAAVGAGIALGVSTSDIAKGLVALKGGLHDNPGRWVAFDGYPFQLIAERGMNSAAFPWTLQTVEAMEVSGKRILMLCAVGDRSDSQYDELTALAAGRFDHYIVYDNVPYRRQRAAGEVPELLRRGLMRKGVDEAAIEAAADLETGMAAAARRVNAGDLILMISNTVAGNESAVRAAFSRHHVSAAQ